MIEAAIGGSDHELDIPAFDIAEFLQALAETFVDRIGRGRTLQPADPGDFLGLLRRRAERRQGAQEKPEHEAERQRKHVSFHANLSKTLQELKSRGVKDSSSTFHSP